MEPPEYEPRDLEPLDEHRLADLLRGFVVGLVIAAVGWSAYLWLR